MKTSATKIRRHSVVLSSANRGTSKRFISEPSKMVWRCKHDQAGYQLLALPLQGDWTEVKALKMTCPSTGAVYVNAVPPNLNEVPAALDWMFNTENYLETVTQQA